MKKAMILIVAMITIIPLSACAKESSAEPITEAVTSEEIHTESESLTSEEETETESLTSETELDELEQRASEILAELESLEAEDRIIYSEESEEESQAEMMNNFREEAKAGKIKASEIEDIVIINCAEFLTLNELSEFMRELNSLLPQEVSSTKPANITKSSKEPQAPASQETVPQVVVADPVQEPSETYPVSDKIDASGWDTGGSKVTVSEGIGESHLTPDQIDRINNIEIN